MLREQVLSDRSDYPKTIDPDWAAAVAKYLEEVGATDLDDPNAPKRKVPRTDAQLRVLDGFERTKARNRAQIENAEALARLADGTAVLRQKKDRTPLQKAKTVTAAKSKKVRGDSKTEHKATKPRRAALLAALNAGKLVKTIRQHKGESRTKEYHKQYSDIASLRYKLGLNIARVHCNQSGQSFYAINNFAHYQPQTAISGMSDNKKELLQALLSKQLVLASDMTSATKVASKTVLRLMREHDLNIYTVFDGSSTQGWILILDEAKRESEISDLGDMVQAIDYLKIRKEVAARMPSATASDIDDATFIEYKRVQKDGQ